MAKKKIVNNIFADPTSVFAGLNAELATKSLMPTITSDRMAVIGIPVQSLAMQYLLGTEGIPFSRMVQIVGSEGSYKSTLMYELMRWYVEAGGLAILIETEAKDSGDIRNAILDWDPDKMRNVATTSVTSTKDWMAYITNVFKYYRTLMSENKQYIPLLVSLDSVTATASEASSDKITDEGFASGSFPTLARDLSEYFKVMPDNVSNFPYTFAWINHVKPGTDSSMYSRGKIPGGKALAYYNSLTLHLGKKKTAESASGTVTHTLEMTTWKNSFGREGRKFDVDVVWYHKEDDDVATRCYFDWDSADIKFLLKLQDGVDIGAELRDKIKEIAQLRTCKVGVKPGVYSDALGITKEEPMTYAQAGKVLHENVDVMNRLKKALYIKPISVFTAGNDYAQFMETVRTENSKKFNKPMEEINGTTIESDENDETSNS